MPVYAGLVLRVNGTFLSDGFHGVIKTGFEIFSPLVQYFEWFLRRTPHPRNINTVALFHC
jgi:hypothetical protein